MNIVASQPLYGVELLDKHKSSQVIVVQGEAARGAAQRMFKEDGVEADKLVVIGWPGKIEDVDLFDWSALDGRSVGIWPNAGDSPRDVANQVVGKAAAVKVFTLPTGVAPGWSLFDELPPGFNLLGHVKAHAAPYVDVVDQPAVGAVATDEQGAGQSPDAGRCDLADEFAEPEAELLRACSMADQAGQAYTTGRDEERRRQQQDENERLQGDVGIMFPTSMTLDTMVDDLVWLAEGEQVAHISENRTMFLTFKEMRSLTVQSVTFEPSTRKGKAEPKPIPNAVLWQRDARRRNVMTRTFHAGADVFCTDPEGARAVNIWRPIKRWPAKAGIDLFLDHVAYLFSDEVERNAFLDWLAHLEQKPGELPHFGWLHVASRTGCGRNWLASVLARVWRGYVAPNVDLPGLLDSSYNGALAGRMLAIVDEIQEGGGENSYRHANKLRSLVNAEYRDINPKYGRQYREHNACRWLVFSNHLNALPIGDTDRRWRVMVHHDAPRSPDVYAELYAALNDQEFINSVAIFLREREIGQFKPGERPPMNAAKRAAIGASKSLIQQRAEEIVSHWPADVITSGDASEVMSEGATTNISAAMRRSLEELEALNVGRQMRIGGKGQRVWILRNHAQWAGQDNATIIGECQRARGGLYSDALASVVLAEHRHGSVTDDCERPI